MRIIAAIVILGLSASAALADSCKAQATEKKLAGAALKSFMTKCEKDANTACEKDAKDKKLSSAAKTSHVKKCTAEAVGT